MCGARDLESPSQAWRPCVFVHSLHLSTCPLQLEAEELLAGFSVLHAVTECLEGCIWDALANGLFGGRISLGPRFAGAMLLYHCAEWGAGGFSKRLPG